jgi:hypothetical protein
MGGIAREHDLKALAVGGADDHAHILLSLPATMPIAKAMREIKSFFSLDARNLGTPGFPVAGGLWGILDRRGPNRILSDLHRAPNRTS